MFRFLYVGTIVSIFVSFLTTGLNQAWAGSSERDSVGNVTQMWINKLTQLNTGAEGPCCREETKLVFAGKGQAENKQGQCPRALMNLVSDDPKSSLLGILPSFQKSCSMPIADSLQLKPQDLLRYYQGQQESGMARYGHLYSTTSQANLEACVNLQPSKTAVLALSKAEYLNKRLYKATDSHLAEVAALDSILGGAKLNGLCTELGSPILQLRCSQYGLSCERQSLRDLAKVTDDLLSRINFATEALKKAKTQEEIAKIEFQLRSYQALAPWLQSKKFMRIKKSGRSTEQALGEQLKESRELLITEVREFSGAQKCITGEASKNCKPTQLREVLDKAMFVSLGIGETPLKKLSPVEKGSYKLKDYEDCILDGKIAQDKAKGTISNATVSAAISLGTLGAGAIISAASSTALVKNLLELGVITAQSHLFVSDMERTVQSCLSKSYALKKSMASAVGPQQISCPTPAKNLSQAIEYDSCFQNGLIAALSAAPLALAKVSFVKAQQKTDLNNWEPKSEADLQRYFYLHTKEVRSNAKKLFAQNQVVFTEVVPKHLKTLKNHDLEKFLSFKTLSKAYGYRGVPKDIIDGLQDASQYKSLISSDGQYIELSVSKSLYLLWGHSPQSLGDKIRNAESVSEKLHWESILKLRNHVVSAMGEIDDKIMGTVYAQIRSPRERVELKLIELLSDLSARSANPLTKTEMGRPVSKASEFLQRMGVEGISSKISDAGSAAEVAEAKKLIGDIGVAQIQKMADTLESNYRSAGMPNSMRTTILAALFVKQKAKTK